MTLTVNETRLWSRLMEMAKIGETSKGGCNRQALTDLDIKGRALFAAWCEEIDLKISYDAIGNMFARREGADDSLAPLVLGSHLDTQPTGGKYDGVLGVLAALEVVTRLHEEGITPVSPIEIANWMNEEGERFAPAMMGSGVWAGMLDLEDIRALKDSKGITVGAELDRHGYTLHSNPKQKAIGAYLELHIEQGPVLENEGKQIGIVTGAQGIRWYDVVLRGQETHAGPSPMSLRHDPTGMLAKLIEGLQKIGLHDEYARSTIGQIRSFPGSRNVVPGRIEISVDLRHPDEGIITKMDASLKALIEELGSSDGPISARFECIWHSPVVKFDDGLINAVRMGAQTHGYSHRDIVSGAGHDALMVAQQAPTAMIFIPCRDGISHNEAEHIEAEQAVAGANTLLAAALNWLEV